MSRVQKAKAWIKENAPMLAVLYENKYVGMAYDHFASLESRQQKQLIVGSFGFFGALVFLFIFSSYIELWSISRQSRDAREMVSLLQRYQSERSSQSGEIESLERNSRLGASGEFKRYLTDQSKMAGISARSVEVQEQEGASGGTDSKLGNDVRAKQATVTLQKVNLLQLKNFLASLENGPYTLSISSIKIINDEKVRGYMKVDVGIIAYSFQGEENS